LQVLPTTVAGSRNGLQMQDALSTFCAAIANRESAGWQLRADLCQLALDMFQAAYNVYVIL
jgi:hypothetical protein